MTFVFLQYPLIPALLTLSLLLSLLAARLRRGGRVAWIGAVGCVTALVLSALACSVPYEEILLLLLLPAGVCLLALPREEQA